MIIRFKKLNAEAVAPTYATIGSSGMDLCATNTVDIEPNGRQMVGTGIAVEIPRDFEGQIRPRSGLAAKHGVTVLNTPGTIDSDYRGEIKVILINLGATPFRVNVGDRIAQLVIAPIVKASMQEVPDLTDTTRGQGGFGSTGR
jgi:dUTP pyrophosphatase